MLSRCDTSGTVGMLNQLYYGDNLEILRQYLSSETIDLCYLDPPFYSQRNYHQTHTNSQKTSQAFIDTWKWGDTAEKELSQIQASPQTLISKPAQKLITSLGDILGKGSLFAYLVSLTIRIIEVHRILKSTGSFYLHCHPVASHYLKLILDVVFWKGYFVNEIIWCYKDPSGRATRFFRRKHDVIFLYTKSADYHFYPDAVRVAYGASTKHQIAHRNRSFGRVVRGHPLGKVPEDWWPMPIVNSQSKERLGYPTQKPEALLARIIQASSRPGDVLLDAYCGCGTSLAVADRLGRSWYGIDQTYAGISLTQQRLNRLGSQFQVFGIPRDLAGVHKLMARSLQEFVKWAVLSYTQDRAVVCDRTVDQPIDGILSSAGQKIILQVNPEPIKQDDLQTLEETRIRAGADYAVLITLTPNSALGFDRLRTVTISEILAQNHY